MHAAPEITSLPYPVQALSFPLHVSCHLSSCQPLLRAPAPGPLLLLREAPTSLSHKRVSSALSLAKQLEPPAASQGSCFQATLQKRFPALIFLSTKRKDCLKQEGERKSLTFTQAMLQAQAHLFPLTHTPRPVLLCV